MKGEKELRRTLLMAKPVFGKEEASERVSNPVSSLLSPKKTLHTYQIF